MVGRRQAVRSHCARGGSKRPRAARHEMAAQCGREWPAGPGERREERASRARASQGCLSTCCPPPLRPACARPGWRLCGRDGSAVLLGCLGRLGRRVPSGSGRQPCIVTPWRFVASFGLVALLAYDWCARRPDSGRIGNYSGSGVVLCSIFVFVCVPSIITFFATSADYNN